MKYNIIKKWIEVFDLIKKNPAIILPFIVIAFFEMIALELSYFAARSPLSHVMNPIIKKFFGEMFLHYPANLVMLPRLFYYFQIIIYVLISVFLTAISVNIFKNIRSTLPVKARAIIKNVLKSYLSFVLFGIVMMIIIIFTAKVDSFVFSKFMRLVSRYLPQPVLKFAPLANSLFLFVSNLIVQAFLILTIPIIVIKKKPIWKALINSVWLGLRNFYTIFSLISLPFLLYFPLILIKNISIQIMDKTFPEIVVLITASGIIISMLVDCFIMICASQWLLDKDAKT